MATIEQKSLLLAKLMKWVVLYDGDKPYVEHNALWLVPYEDNIHGKALFSEIFLEFPEVMLRFTAGPDAYGYVVKPTQGRILDEILRMNGYDV